ncbi:MAG: hypothetical protein EP326_09175 [Deltaproteobacteria bacterium]|jgi:hypothetical protein|nr:MAG: hypothetical protein EP326_09175 [Deltaproteobacteria bacterium]TNF31066.1 MAG: hypothetical protein EP319_03270 [Deltaproteobacteria bacterium]
MIKLILLTFILIPKAFAGWIDADEELKNTFLVPKICSEVVVSNETTRIFDSDQCIKESIISIFKKYITFNRGEKIVTLMRFNVDVLGISCEGKLKKTFATTYVNHRGEIVTKPAGWEIIYVDNCELRENQIVLQASLSDSHVKKVTKATFEKINKKAKERIKSLDLEVELETPLEYISTQYYFVMDPNQPRKRTGYMEVSKVQELESDSTYDVLVRYDLNGLRIGELEY